MFKRIIIIIAIISLTGCSWFEDKRVVVKPKQIDTSSYEFRRALALIIKSRYETTMSADEIVRWMYADEALKKYLLKENEDETLD